MLPRIASRSLRTYQNATRPVTLQNSFRAYAKAGKPRAAAEYKPHAHSASSIVNPKHVSPSTRTPSTVESSASTAASSNAQPTQQNPVSQEKLDEEAIDAMPTTLESESKSAIGAQAETSQEGTQPGQDAALQDSSTLDASEVSNRDTTQQIPLHDLTKGLPSTLDAELEEASRKQAEAEAVGQEQGARAAGGGRGGRPVRDYTTSAERRRNRMVGWLATSFALMILTSPVYLGRNWESEEEERLHPQAPNGWGLMLFWNRLRARMTSTLDYYSEPAFQKLLPDPDPMWARPYTLVLSLEDLLVHSEWSREHGWRMAKRPGLDYFLRYLSSYYEIVIFTSVPSMIGAPALQKLDPFGMVMFRLFREATRYENGEYIKDLSYLNRPLDKIIAIDTVAAHTSAQPRNAIILPRWKGDPKDKELVALIPFLEYIAGVGMEDTRKTLDSFKGKHIPTEFAAREAEMRKRFNEQMAEERKKRPRRSGVGFLGSSLGIRADQGLMQLPPGEMSLAEGLEKGMMLHDVIRARGQKQYEMLEKEIRENSAEWLKQMKEEDEKMRDEQMKGVKQGIFGWFGGNGGEKVEKT